MTAKHSITAACLMMAAGSLQAGVSPEAADKLGDSLTPMGAERAGNADGSIPAWEGGLTTVHPDFEPGGSYPDPYADEEPLFVEGLGLDSIDALELALAINKEFGVKTAADDERNRNDHDVDHQEADADGKARALGLKKSGGERERNEVGDKDLPLRCHGKRVGRRIVVRLGL